MSRDENFDAGRTLTSSPVLHHSIFEPNANPSRRRIRFCTGADTWTSGFLPIRSTPSLSCNAAPVNCGCGDCTNATKRHRTGLPAALRRTNLSRCLEQDNSDWPASLTCSLPDIRRVHPSRCTIHTRPLSSPKVFRSRRTLWVTTHRDALRRDWRFQGTVVGRPESWRTDNGTEFSVFSGHARTTRHQTHGGATRDPARRRDGL